MSSRNAMQRAMPWVSILLVLLALMPMACQTNEKPAPASETQAQPKGELVIEDNALGAWIAINNSFAMPPQASRDAGKHYYWAGVLLQVGDFAAVPNVQPPRFQFEKLYFSKAGQVVGTALDRGNYSSKQFWVNIVAQKTGYELPMKETDAAQLCPTTAVNPYCADATASDPRCLRGKKIHGGLEPVLGIVTYWQGPQGFELKAVQESADLGSSYTFKLLDAFAVDVYDVAADGSATKVVSYAADEIDRITLAKKPFGPSDGDKIDPPWPGK